MAKDNRCCQHCENNIECFEACEECVLGGWCPADDCQQFETFEKDD